MTDRDQFHRALRLTTALAVVLTAAPALAQTADTTQRATLEEVVVTAQKREQRLQDVPIAVTAITATALENNRIQTVRDLNGLAPGLLVSTVTGGSLLPIYGLRGAYSPGNQLGADRGVATYMDGVYIAAANGAMFAVADMERIEVLRGPQGTLFGRNATGGAISFITREPDGKFAVHQTLGVGNYNQFRTATRISLPQIGPFSAAVNYTHSQRRGDMRNLGAGTVWDLSRAYGRPYTLTSPKYLGNENTEAVQAAVKAEFDDLKAVYPLRLHHR